MYGDSSPLNRKREESMWGYKQSIFIKDYELVRKEMSDLKDCITNYIGFVLGGSAIAFYGLLYSGIKDNRFDLVIYLTMIASVILSFILLNLFYKFNSYNRYAGYCKLLNHELIHETQLHEWISWEYCVDKVRQYDFDNTIFNELITNIQIAKNNNEDTISKEELISKITSTNEDAPKPWILKVWRLMKVILTESLHGFIVIIAALTGKIKTKSWKYPPLVTAIFFVLNMFFLILGLYSFYQLKCKSTKFSAFDWLAMLAVSIIQVYLWLYFCKSMHSLIKGTKTIEKYFWRFLLTRAYFLNRVNVKPKYLSY
jgi:hypothetical protein